MSTKTSPPTSDRRATAEDRGSKPGSEFRRHELGTTLLATLFALGTVLLVQTAAGLTDMLAVAVLAYLAFVITLSIGGWLRARRRRRQPPPAQVEPPAWIDLTVPEPDDPVLAAEPFDFESIGRSALEPEDAWPETLVPASAETPRRFRKVTPGDVVEGTWAALAGLAIALVQHSVAGSHGLLGLVIVWYLAFITVYVVLVLSRAGVEAAIDRTMTVLLYTVGGVVIALVTWMLIFLLAKGLPALRPGFFTEDLSKTGPLTPGGGAKHAIIGTIEQVGIATAVVVPLAVLTAVYLNEFRGRLATPIRFIVDAMSGLPSIVAGLLVFTVWVNGRGYSGFAASIALIVLMLPTVTRASEEILKTVADSLREASLALGAPQRRVILRVVIPTARAGLVTAVILGIARGIGETAPVLLTAFGSDTTNTNPFDGPQGDLPLFVWKLIRVPNETQNQRAWTGLLVLVMLVLILFVTARAVSNRGQRKLGRSR